MQMLVAESSGSLARPIGQHRRSLAPIGNLSPTLLKPSLRCRHGTVMPVQAAAYESQEEAVRQAWAHRGGLIPYQQWAPKQGKNGGVDSVEAEPEPDSELNELSSSSSGAAAGAGGSEKEEEEDLELLLAPWKDDPYWTPPEGICHGVPGICTACWHCPLLH